MSTVPTSSRTSRLPIEYWSDPLCIWAYVAQPRLEAILERFGDEIDVHYHVVPVFGSVPWRFREGSWADKGVAGRVAATARVAAMFGHNGVDGTCWEKAAPASSWAPGMAIKAAFSLEASGLIEAGKAAAYQWELRRAFFERGENIAERAVQLQVAETVQLKRAPLEVALSDGSALAALWEDDHRRHESRIQGSPTYVFDGGRARLYGNFNERVLHLTVEALLEDLVGGASHC